MHFLIVFVGGGIGSLFRYMSSEFINRVFFHKFLLGTIFVNCVGALLIGFLMSLIDFYSLNVKWKLLLVTGFLGGYTTFSAYSYETVHYMLNGDMKYAIWNILLSNGLCIMFVFLGIGLHKLIFAK
jgi:CrcB protein